MDFFTILGISKATGETVCEAVEAENWITAAFMVGETWAGDFQFVGAFEGRPLLVGCFESIPNDPAQATIIGRRHRHRPDCWFTVVGFDYAADEAVCGATSVSHWLIAVDKVWRKQALQRDELNFRPVGVFAGVLNLAGSWQMLREIYRQAESPKVKSKKRGKRRSGGELSPPAAGQAVGAG
jgi:hypothetical protein